MPARSCWRSASTTGLACAIQLASPPASLSAAGWIPHGSISSPRPRETTGLAAPEPFSESTHRLERRLAALSDRTVERVDPDWIDEVALLPEGQLDRIAARWIDLIDCEECSVNPDEKPMLRELAGDLLGFCRRAEGAEDVLFAWSV